MFLTRIIRDLQVAADMVPLIKPLLHPFARFYFGHIDKSHSKILSDMKSNFDSNGLDVLAKFDKILTENNYMYSLAFGTMLGAVREHGFIPHDLDIDVFVWKEDIDNKFYDILKESGFKMIHSFQVDQGKCGREDTIECEGVHMDIFFLYPKLEGREYPYCCDFFAYKNARTWDQSMRLYGGVLPRRLEMPSEKSIVRVPFYSLSLPVLSNAHEFLSFRYGSSYMTPDPTWSNGDNPYIIPWPEKLAKYIQF